MTREMVLKKLVLRAIGAMHCGAVLALGCGLDWTIPKNHFDGVDEQGYVSYWGKVGDVDLGDGLQLPLFINFHSNRNTSSPYLGKGWILPLLESNFTQVDEGTFMMVQPDGWKNIFRRDAKHSSVLNGSAGWKAAISRERITAWASCGWKLTFLNGRIKSITTPGSRVLNVSYMNGIASNIDEQGNVILEVVRDSASGRVIGLKAGENRIRIELGTRPRVDVTRGVNTVRGMEQTLHQAVLENGVQARYEFAVDKNLHPTLTISGHSSRWFTWDAATGRAMKDGEWTYDIQPSKDPWRNAAIGRTNGANQREFWHYDGTEGKEISETVDKSKTVKAFFTSGVLTGKIRAIINARPGISTSELLFSYDERGNLIRISDNAKRQWEGKGLLYLGENRIIAYSGSSDDCPSATMQSGSQSIAGMFSPESRLFIPKLTEDSNPIHK